MAERDLRERILELLTHADPAQRQAGRELLAALDVLPAEATEIKVQALHQRIVGGLRLVAEVVEWGHRVEDLWLLVSPDLAAAARVEAALVASPLREGARRVVVVEGAPGPADLIVHGVRASYPGAIAADRELPRLAFGKGRRAVYARGDATLPLRSALVIQGDEYAHQSQRELLLALDHRRRKRR